MTVVPLNHVIQIFIRMLYYIRPNVIRYSLQDHKLRPQTIIFLLHLLFNLGNKVLLFALTTNLQSGPRFADIWCYCDCLNTRKGCQKTMRWTLMWLGLCEFNGKCLAPESRQYGRDNLLILQFTIQIVCTLYSILLPNCQVWNTFWTTFWTRLHFVVTWFPQITLINLVLCLINLHQKVSNGILGQLIFHTAVEYDS